MENLQELLKLVQSVPQEIRNWIGSEKTTYLIGDINRRLGFEEENLRIIPRLILRLEVRNLLPQNFAAELNKELNKPIAELKPIIEEIKENILQPIENELFKWGVDIRLIKAEGGMPLSNQAAPTLEIKTPGSLPAHPPLTEKPSAPAPVVSNQPVPPPMPPSPPLNRVEIIPPPAPAAPEKPAASPTPPILQSAAPQPATPQQNAPFMLYKKEEQKPIAESIKTGITGEIAADTKPTTPKVAARIEIGPEFPKIVHYTESKTLINSKGAAALPPAPPPSPAGEQKPIEKINEQVIDLSSFKPVAPASGQPKINGNTVDLR